MTLGDRIKRLRIESGMTQTDLAKALDSQGASAKRIAISRWENNASVPALWQLKCVANVFGVTIDYLVEGNENHPMNKSERDVIEAIRTNPHVAKIIICLQQMKEEQIQMTCKIVCSIIHDGKE